MLTPLVACPETSVRDAGGDQPDRRTGGGDGGSGDSGGSTDASSRDVLGDTIGSDLWVLRCPDDDLHEPNDSAAEAAALSRPGPIADLISCDAEDWYQITIPASFGFSAQLDFSATAANLDLFLYRADDPVTPIDSSQSDRGREQVYLEQVEVDTSVLIRVVNTSAPDTTTYDLLLVMHQNGTCVTDTAYEPNDTPETAAAMEAGNHTDLVGCDQEDWYLVSVPADNGISADLNHDPAQANLDLYLYLASDPSTPLASQTTYAPRKHVHHEIVRQPTDMLVRVHNASYPGPRTTYALDLQLHPGGYCVDDNHEPNDEPGSASPMTRSASGTLCRDNIDHYSFTVPQAGPRSRVEVGYVESEPGVVPVIAALSTAEGSPVTSAETVTPGRTVLVFDSVDGQGYLLRISKAPSNEVIAQSYQLQVRGVPPPNDDCAAAIDLAPTGDEPVLGTAYNGFDDVAFAAGAASCVGHAASGPDVLYRLSIPPGQSAGITLKSDGNHGLALIDSCQARCCYGGVDDKISTDNTPEEETLVLYNDSSQTLTPYLVVDSRWPDDPNGFELSLQLAQGAAPEAFTATCAADAPVDGGSGD